LDSMYVETSPAMVRAERIAAGVAGFTGFQRC
jgi:hypothetical protein